MRNWANPEFDGTLEEACAMVPRAPYIQRTALEVAGTAARAGERRVLAPRFDLELTPRTGETMRCSSLDDAAVWTVVCVAKGYPGAMICGNFPEDFPADFR